MRNGGALAGALGARLHWITAAGIAFCLLLQLHLVFVQPVNWDEFRFLADVHTYGRGELSAVLLTFQVHLFGWLTGIGNEIDQIRVARLVMLSLEMGTLYLIWSIARRFFEPAAALFAVLGYISFSFVLQHGASFRFDPILTFLVMLSIALLMRERLRWIEMLLVGFALALATMITVKAALGLPLVVAVGLYRLLAAENHRDAFMRLGLAALSSALFLGILYTWHLATLAGATTTGAQGHLAASYTKTLSDIPFFPRFNYFMRSLLENPLHWLAILLGISAVIGGYGKSRGRTLLLLAFVLPLLSIGLYRNAYPYFYAFVMAPAAIFFAAAAGRDELRKVMWLPALLMAAGALVHHQAALSSAGADQRRTIEAIHAMFPRPVPYLDRCSMIASYPQAGLFLSSWGIENYSEAGRPIIEDLLVRTEPVFVIANSPVLINALENRMTSPGTAQLLEEDEAVLRSNFVHHWGPIWVAGKDIVVARQGKSIGFLIAGNYTLESHGPLLIDGRPVRPGGTLFVARGIHTIASATDRQRVTLRWGAQMARPNGSAPRELEFGRF